MLILYHHMPMTDIALFNPIWYYAYANGGLLNPMLSLYKVMGSFYSMFGLDKFTFMTSCIQPYFNSILSYAYGSDRLFFLYLKIYLHEGPISH